MLFVNNQASRFVMWIVPNQFQPYWIDAVKMEQLKCIYVYVLCYVLLCLYVMLVYVNMLYVRVM